MTLQRARVFKIRPREQNNLLNCPAIFLSPSRERHVIQTHACLEALQILEKSSAECQRNRRYTRAEKENVATWPRAVFSEQYLLHQCIIAALSAPTRWAFHEKKERCYSYPTSSYKVRVSAMKRFDKPIGFLGVTAELTRWVRVVADVNTVSKRFDVVTCYPAYYNPAELKKIGTHSFKPYAPICICHRRARTPYCFLETIVSQHRKGKKNGKATSFA